MLIILPSFLSLVGERSNREGWSRPEKVDHPLFSFPSFSPRSSSRFRSPFVVPLSPPRIASRLDRRDEEVTRQAARNDTSFVIAFFGLFFFFYLRPRNKFGNKLREAQLACLSRWRAATFEEAKEEEKGGMSRWPRFNRHVRGRRFSSPRLMAEPAQMTALMEE